MCDFDMLLLTNQSLRTFFYNFLAIRISLLGVAYHIVHNNTSVAFIIIMSL